MRKRVYLWLLIISLLALGLVGIAQAAEEKTFHWTQYDFDVTIRDNGDVDIEVYMDIEFTKGQFEHGFFAFSTERVDEVTNVAVWEGRQQYSRGQNAAGTYSASTSGGEFRLDWWFPSTERDSRSFTLKYTVKGLIRLYEGGDQFYADFYSGDRPARIDQGTITIHLPAAVKESELKIGTAGPDADWELVDSRTILVAAQDIPANRTLTVRVQFPHGLVTAAKPAWQEAYDRQAEYDENVKPMINLFVGVVSVLLLIGGPLLVYLLWYTRGRDKPVGLVADYLAEPPSDLPAGVVGTLVDEKAEMKDIIASIVDLARRGVLTMTEVEEPGFIGIGTKHDFIFRQADTSQPLRKYEERLIYHLLGGIQERKLSDLKEKFYTAIPKLQTELYQEVVREEFFHGSPERTRNVSRGIGIAGLVLTGVLGFCGLASLSTYTDAAICPFIGLGVAFIAVIIVGFHMPRKTPKGAEASARWLAFKRYLKDIEKYTDLEQAKEIFDKYLPYTIAFGFERSWIKKFAAIDTPAPSWYMPYPPIIVTGDRGRGRGAGRAASTAGVGGGQAPSLEGMSQGMAASLQSMSDGLVSMLNSASSVLTSSPAPKASSGGWSGGGGGSSGGSMGGGGSGFN